MLDISDQDSKIPLLSTMIQSDSSWTPSPIEEKKKNNVLSSLSNFHFSIKTLPSRQECLKKYLTMLLSAGGGLGYWSAVEKYNQNHDLDEFLSTSNIVCVVIVTSFFLLQSVDLARKYLEKLAGSAPVELSEIIEIPPEEIRRAIKRKTAGGSLISGFPFLIIGINDSLPIITKIVSEIGRKTGTGAWAIYFYLVNVGLHILPFILIQTPEFSYYFWPIKKIYHFFQKMRQTDQEKRNFKEIEQAQFRLLELHNIIRGLIATRLSSSMSLFFEKIAANISIIPCYNSAELNKIVSVFSEETKGLDRLLSLLRDYPPQLRPPALSPKFQYLLRIIGAQLELGGAFIWWTNIFPTLFKLFSKMDMKLPLVYFLTVALGITPSYVLFVLLAFLGENQFPRLIHYLINAVKKFFRVSHADSLLPPIAQARPFLFAIGTLTIAYLSYFAPVNARSLNEEQYQDTLPAQAMTVLDVYAIIGISTMAFISLLDLFKNYLTEASAVFSSSFSASQLQARLIITQENLLNDLMRISPNLLIEELKNYNDDEILHLLLGNDKDRTWLDQIKEKIKEAEFKLEQKKIEVRNLGLSSSRQIQTAILNQPKSTFGLLSSCRAALFSISNCFTCCFKRSNRSQHTSMQS